MKKFAGFFSRLGAAPRPGFRAGNPPQAVAQDRVFDGAIVEKRVFDDAGP